MIDLKRQDFYYHLPQELIAQHPTDKREESRLMVLDKETGEVDHKVFKDIVGYFTEGDCLVLNDTRVIPARLYGQKSDTSGKIELLLLNRLEDDKWETLVKPGKKAKIGTEIIFGDGILKGQIIENTNSGGRIIKFHYNGIFEEILDKLGEMPLPPYITEKLKDKERYQTVYSKKEGSAAAPTAGLHFTHQLIEEIRSKGVEIVYITLHVGLGTFRPVKAESLDEHLMHSEYYEVHKETADTINRVKSNGGRIFSVGTTSTRTLESVADDNGRIEGKSGWTDIFIYPGYKFKVVDSLITNFHLSESTLIMLISALAGRENVLRAYKIAVEERYRFYSLGDGMLIK